MAPLAVPSTVKFSDMAMEIRHGELELPCTPVDQRTEIFSKFSAIWDRRGPRDFVMAGELPAEIKDQELGAQVEQAVPGPPASRRVAGAFAHASRRIRMISLASRILAAFALAALLLPASATAQPTAADPMAPRQPLTAPSAIRDFPTPAEIATRELTLSETVRIGLDNAPVIIQRFGEYAAAQQRIDQAFSAMLPQLSFFGQANRSDEQFARVQRFRLLDQHQDRHPLARQRTPQPLPDAVRFRALLGRHRRRQGQLGYRPGASGAAEGPHRPHREGVLLPAATQRPPRRRQRPGGGSGGAEPQERQGFLRRGHPPQVRRDPRGGGRGQCARQPHPGPERGEPGPHRPQPGHGHRHQCPHARQGHPRPTRR